MGSASLINSSAMAPSKCASIGGNCCNFYNASWDGGITGMSIVFQKKKSAKIESFILTYIHSSLVYYENPRKLPSHKFSVCDGCYFLNLSIESHSSASVPIPFFCSLSTYFSIFSCVVFLLLIPNLK